MRYLTLALFALLAGCGPLYFPAGPGINYGNAMRQQDFQGQIWHDHARQIERDNRAIAREGHYAMPYYPERNPIDLRTGR